MTNLADKIKQDEETNKDIAAPRGGNDWFKFQEGANQFRVLTEPQVLYEKFKVGICYTDCGYTGTPKYLTWILDRADGKVKLMKMPYMIFKQLAEYQQDEDYKFDTFPIPFDIKVTALKAGTKEVEYTCMAKPFKELTDEENVIITTHMIKKETLQPDEIIEKMKQKQIEKHQVEGKPQIDPATAPLPTIQVEQPDTSEVKPEEISTDNIPF
mgnify:CR=1 FL=1|jgi:hypothetical protein|tara:strand:+ start:9283 stop:9918 length:636 start_codon:yes stop_codon:yes gene_type:complete